MYTTLTSNLQRGRIFVLALTLLAATGLRAQNTPVITGTKVPSPGFVNIYGSGFGTTTGTVLVGSGAATVTYWNDTEVQFSAYTNQTATYTVSVTTSTGAIANFVVSLVSATVGSATTDRGGSATINSVSINGGSNQAHVGLGATFNDVEGSGSPRVALHPLRSEPELLPGNLGLRHSPSIAELGLYRSVLDGQWRRSPAGSPP